MRKSQVAMREQCNFIDDCLHEGPFSTIGRMAEAAGLDSTSVYRARKCEHSLNINSLAALAEACGLGFVMRAVR